MGTRTKHHRLLAVLAKKLKGYPNVVGFGPAIRVIQGKPTRRNCLAVFVTRKVRRDKLTKEHTLPKSVTIGGKRHLLDVLEVRRLRPQIAFGDGLSCNVSAGQAEKGTRSAYFRKAGQLFALSCAHVIWGESETSPDPPVTISSYKPTGNSYARVPFAVSTLEGRKDDGAQTPSDWGYIDCGSAVLNADVVPQIVFGPKLNCFVGKTFDDFYALKGKRVTGHGLVSDPCSGIVHSVVTPLDLDPVHHVDFIVVPDKRDGTLTMPGDSGMLWKLDDGTVVGMHSLGDMPEGGGASTITIGTFIQRILPAVGATEIYS